MYILPLPLHIGTRGGVEDKRHQEKVTTRRSVIINNIINIRSLSYITICCESCNWSTRREHYVSHYIIIIIIIIIIRYKKIIATCKHFAGYGKSLTTG